jgi:hypothetical protein
LKKNVAVICGQSFVLRKILLPCEILLIWAPFGTNINDSPERSYSNIVIPRVTSKIDAFGLFLEFLNCSCKIRLLYIETV